MIKIIFLIHDLGAGGAEKVLVNLVNHMDTSKFDITVVSMFGGGINEQYLKPHIHYRTVWKRMIPANSYWTKTFSPEKLHDICIKGKYDIEISYLEGMSIRAISGCRNIKTKLIAWTHVEQKTRKTIAEDFRSEKEAEACFSKFDRHIFVADSVRQDFVSLFPQEKPCMVIYNTVESEKIIQCSKESAFEIIDDGLIRLVSVGTLKQVKGFERLLNIVQKLVSMQYPIHLYLLGDGPLRQDFDRFIVEHSLQEHVTLLGYQSNPYKYVSKCDLFVCSSYREGFSTAVTEALIVGTPVVTTKVSGMEEMLGQNNEYGLIVENNEDALYFGVKQLLDDQDRLNYYKEKAAERGKDFSTQKTVDAVEKMLLELLE